MKKFYHKTNKNEKKYYSLNFLLSESLITKKTESNKSKQKNRILKKKSVDMLHDNLDQRNYFFYKPISKILKKY